MLGQPSFHFGVLVSGVIVGDEMEVKSGRRLLLDGLEEGEPLLVAMGSAMRVMSLPSR
jgi:hypothetical protein